MNTKEAIEACKCILNWPLDTIRTTEENIGKFREVIKLLQRGEKYEARWKEITSYIMHYNFGNQYVPFREEIRPKIKDIK